MIDLTGKSVLVVGAGISGIGSATLLEEKGALQSCMMAMRN